MGNFGNLAISKDSDKTEQFKSSHYLNDSPQEIYSSTSNAIFKGPTDIYDTYTKLKDMQSGTTGAVSKILFKELMINRALKYINIKNNPKLLNEAKREIAILKNLVIQILKKYMNFMKKKMII